LAIRLWNASTASSTQKMPLTSRHNAEPLLSSVLAGGAALSSALAWGIESSSLLLQLAGGQDDKGLRPGVIVGHGQMYVDGVAFRRKGVKPSPCSAAQL
jgi:hypothetical protein